VFNQSIIVIKFCHFAIVQVEENIIGTENFIFRLSLLVSDPIERITSIWFYDLLGPRAVLNSGHTYEKPRTENYIFTWNTCWLSWKSPPRARQKKLCGPKLARWPYFAYNSTYMVWQPMQMRDIKLVFQDWVPPPPPRVTFYFFDDCL